MRLFLDANCIIYLHEGAPDLQLTIQRRIAHLATAGSVQLLVSRLSLLECRVKPIRDSDRSTLAVYDRFFAADGLVVVELSPAVVERATKLRASVGLRTPDALQMACAIESCADLFLTGDKQLARCTEVAVEVIVVG